MFGEMRVDGDNSGFKVDTEAIWRVGDESGLRRAAQSEWSRLQPMRLIDPRCESVASQVASVVTASDGQSISGHLQRVYSNLVYPAR
ncbi:hypothetical protein CEP54_007002 [Fusarium duplospermum]|uniref:Uncharacterized protein n=1 Tax=Fusarium duplospermum TaxID=1325734 RepID=A0A428Q457_9HYPO|nr:hypothetical protein CEP54_007002 [Fusarium duplospermum]